MTTWRRAGVVAAVAVALLTGSGAASAQLVINEVDYDQPGAPDAAEFIEIFNPGPDPVDLDTWSIALINGDSTPVEYDSIDLPAVSLAAGDYYVVCGDPAAVSDCDLDAATDSNLIQNGAPDAIELRDGATAIDTVSYEGSVAGFTEGTGDAGDDGTDLLSAMARFPDGTDTGDNDADFTVRCATPGAANGSASALCACGNGTLDPGEVCDESSNNGTTECGCTLACDYAPPATPCGDVTPTAECDLADQCDGVGTCDPNPAPAGQSCGDPASSECDQPDICDGSGSCYSNPVPPDAPCGDQSGSECNLPDTCDGGGSCLSNLFADGEPCGDQSVSDCTGPDDCQDGVCVTNDAVAGQSCGDPSASDCDGPDTCDGAGTCEGNETPAGGACGSQANTACTDPDTCDDDGVCQRNHAAAGTACGDRRDGVCTNPDECDGSGRCDANDEPDGTSCADNVFCDGEELCMDAQCVASAGPCAQGDACDEDQDRCTRDCGDGAVAAEEDCDDGNLDDGDGCTDCTVDVGWVCGDDAPTDGTSDCYMSCGDGQVDLYETCDDDNVDPGDGCDDHCQIEPGWDCFEDENGQQVCAPMCGDGLVLPGEECDDANLGREDGCSHCQVEVGWLCDDSEPSQCTQLPDDGGCSAAGGGGSGLWAILLLLLPVRRGRSRCRVPRASSCSRRQGRNPSRS